MNYSPKKSVKFFSRMFSGVLPALLAVVAAIWFSGGARTAPEAMAMEIPPVEEKESEVGFLNPTDGVLTSTFGERWGGYHKGIDIGADMGTDIYATLDGVVKYAGVQSGYGNYIEISHRGGFETAYAHCEELLVKAGDAVSRGQIIAYVGSTGNSTGPHLHFEVRHNGECQNPLEFVIY